LNWEDEAPAEPEPLSGSFALPDRRQTELVERRIERAVEDEFFHELRRLEQRVFLAGRFGEVLIQVAQEPRVPSRIGEVVDEHAGVGVDLLKEPQQFSGRIAREPIRQLAQRIGRSEHVPRPR